MKSPVWPTLAEARVWLGLADGDDDQVLADSAAAASAAQAALLDLPAGPLPGDVRLAWLLRVQRLAARRNSPEGIVGVGGVGGDFVAARLPSTDPDIARLEGPWAPVVLA